MQKSVFVKVQPGGNHVFHRKAAVEMAHYLRCGRVHADFGIPLDYSTLDRRGKVWNSGRKVRRPVGGPLGLAATDKIGGLGRGFLTRLRGA